LSPDVVLHVLAGLLHGLFLDAPPMTAASVLLSRGYPSGLKNLPGAGMVEISTR
jgi:hypothetical protein